MVPSSEGHHCYEQNTLSLQEHCVGTHKEGEVKSRREHGVTPATARSEEGRINSFCKEPGDFILDSWLPEPGENTFCYFMVICSSTHRKRILDHLIPVSPGRSQSKPLCFKTSSLILPLLGTTSSRHLRFPTDIFLFKSSPPPK